jgi:hypothetical protein
MCWIAFKESHNLRPMHENGSGSVSDFDSGCHTRPA